ncbi:hypothetical protein DIE19_07440 [Burkholderia sp. Bp9126]|nr:hypothetical protein DIE19_07440 [Burkholderia sp. Bp9126]
MARPGSRPSTSAVTASAARARKCSGCATPRVHRHFARAMQERLPSTVAQLFCAKIELLIFIEHLYVPDVSFAPHQ